MSFLQIIAELRELDDESSAQAHRSRVCTLLPAAVTSLHGGVWEI